MRQPTGPGEHGRGYRHLAALGAGSWAAHGLRPHRFDGSSCRTSGLAAKLRDVVGLYLDPPAHSLVLSVDENDKCKLSTAPYSRACR